MRKERVEAINKSDASIISYLNLLSTAGFQARQSAPSEREGWPSRREFSCPREQGHVKEGPERVAMCADEHA